MNKYIQFYENALQGYTDQGKNRPGYKKTWFSRWRHSYKSYPHIEKLKQDLDKAVDDEAAKEILQVYFSHKDTQFNNHSFSRFLLDQLQMQCRDEQWEAYDPTPIVFLKHIKDLYLYRGTQQTPLGSEGVFARGMLDQSPRDKIDPYLQSSSLRVGISTTKEYAIANAYARQAWITPTAKGVIYRSSTPVYVYKIDYRDGNGVDIVETVKARKLGMISQHDASKKQEVNILGKIVPEDIVGVWEITGRGERFIANPKYQAERKTLAMTVPERLGKLFEVK